jgi:hypothetical protein
MTPSTGVPRTALRYARWGLPWVCALVVSATLTYVVNDAVAGGSWARQTQVNIAAQQAVDGPSVTEGFLVAPTEPMGSDSRDGCDISGGRLLYVGLNTWLPTEAKVAPCPIGDR